ncbi:hypothetical protein QJS04_geneDACA006178 [Acorus gramineus]|uniref:Vam6/Vps39-like protein n=1 Tax=Acorus gramineus TaxID=55184 RepID=A0AAV9B0L9_ACOGR|nr:hypothetical protein QJS04_geneDACA006178 [Acorus gramineus]
MIMNSATGALSEVFPSGRIAPPLVMPLPSGELLLGKVRSFRAPYQLVQTVALRDVRLLTLASNCVIAVLDNSVYGLLPVPVAAQIVQLTASGDFEEALALCKLLPPEDSTLRAAKESSIHIRYGHYLFDNGSYEEALDQFLASQVDISYVLALYPSILLPKTLSVIDSEKMNMSDTSKLLRVSSDTSDDMESISPAQLSESDEKSALEAKKMGHNALIALVKYLQKKRNAIVERATAEVTEEVVQSSITSYSSNRSRAQSKIRGHTQISSGARETAALLDTALIQAMVLTGQSSTALELLKGINYCDLKICEEFLRQRDYYSALLELYKSNEMHREALELLTQLVEESNSDQSQSELSQKYKPDMIIDYLKPLCRTDPMLALEYSMHILESCPTQTIELFLSGNIPPDLVNSYLKQHGTNMQSTYLELMLAMDENGIPANLQSELVQLYLSEVLDWHAGLMEEQKWDEKLYSPTRKKLLSAFENISGYNPDALLKRLPTNALYEERAILLGKMNQHQRALSLYVHKLHLPEMALAYCDRVYESVRNRPSSRSSANIYVTLLQIYLNVRRVEESELRPQNPLPSFNTGYQKVFSIKSNRRRVSNKIAEIEGADEIHSSPNGTDSGRSDGDVDELNGGGEGPIMLNEALDLLSKRWDRINGAQALRLLPRDTKLLNLRPFLTPLLKKSSEGRHNYSVIKGLRQSENLQVKEDLYEQRKRVVKIDGDSTCSLCNKRIGSSVFAVYPNGKTLVHFICFENSQNVKAVRGAPKTRWG